MSNNIVGHVESANMKLITCKRHATNHRNAVCWFVPCSYGHVGSWHGLCITAFDHVVLCRFFAQYIGHFVSNIVNHVAKCHIPNHVDCPRNRTHRGYPRIPPLSCPSPRMPLRECLIFLRLPYCDSIGVHRMNQIGNRRDAGTRWRSLFHTYPRCKFIPSGQFCSLS